MPCPLRPATAGRILIDGKDITDLAPRERQIGYVPQDYVLFPTRRVLDNIIFGLRHQGVSRTNAVASIGDIIELLGIESLLDRWPATHNEM